MHSAKCSPLIFLPQDPQTSHSGPRISFRHATVGFKGVNPKRQQSYRGWSELWAGQEPLQPSSPGRCSGSKPPTGQPSAPGNAGWAENKQHQRILEISDLRNHCWAPECPGEHPDPPISCPHGTRAALVQKENTNHQQQPLN